MKNKLIILIVLLFMVTGCTAQYDLEIDDSTITETTTVKVPKTAMTKEEATVYSKQEIPITQDPKQKTFYNSSINENQNFYYLSFKYPHNFETFTNSYFVKQCYKEVTLTDNSKQIELSTSDLFMCINLQDGFHVDSAQINITTKLKVIDNNADEINDNTYTCNINENNYLNKPIKITIQKEKNLKNIAENIKVNRASTELFIIYGGISFILICIILLVIFKLKKNNKI